MCTISVFMYQGWMCPGSYKQEAQCWVCADIHMHMNSCLHLPRFFFFSNFMIILLCENFISYHKSGFATVTYLIELLNNFNIPATSRIFIYSFPHVLCFPRVRRQLRLYHSSARRLKAHIAFLSIVQKMRSCL